MILTARAYPAQIGENTGRRPRAHLSSLERRWRGARVNIGGMGRCHPDAIADMEKVRAGWRQHEASEGSARELGDPPELCRYRPPPSGSSSFGRQGALSPL